MADRPDTPVTLHEGSANAPFLFVCEHASNHIPEKYDGLGLRRELRTSHIAWDPGAETVTRHLCRSFDAPAVLGQVSRLVYDCNRPPEAADAIPEKSELFEVPGNCNLSPAEISERVESCYRPFEAALSDAIDRQEVAPALVTIHSFTPVYFGRKRDVQIGILHDDDTRLADAMIDAAGRHTTLEVRRNEPYGPEDGVTHTLRRHGVRRGLPNVMIEIRNDLLIGASNCEEIASSLAEILKDGLAGLANDRPAAGAIA